MTRRRSRPAPRPPEPPEPTGWQTQALRDLVQIASSQPEELTIAGDPVIEPDGTRVVRVAMRTADLPERAPKGVRFRDVEEFSLHLEATGDRPPPVVLDHYRFLGVAHVMSGVQICLYLDPARDWDPESGIRGVLDLLWQWMEDAAADRFRPDQALYHAVGGVAHVSPGTPTVVVRNLPDSGRHVDAMYLRRRTGDRLDLVSGPAQPGDQHVPVVRLRRDIPVGAGHDVLGDLLTRLEVTQGLQPVWPDAWQAPQTRRLFIRSPLRLTLAEHAVTGHPQVRGGCALSPVINPWGLREVDTARELLSPAADLAAAIVASAGRNRTGQSPVRRPHGPAPQRWREASAVFADRPAARGRLSAPPPETRTTRWIRTRSSRQAEGWQWSGVGFPTNEPRSRRDVTTAAPCQRSTARPCTSGCGGLGSWVAEFVVRAAHTTSSSTMSAGDGGVCRQNYVEEDIGALKAASLAVRLRSIRDDVDVAVMTDLPATDVVGEMLAADLVIDATISHVAGRFLNQLASAPDRRAVFAQVATDARTGTLGVAFVNAPTGASGPDTAPPTLQKIESLLANGHQQRVVGTVSGLLGAAAGGR